MNSDAASRAVDPNESDLAGAASLTDIVLTTFFLNGRFLEVAESLARPVGLTAARWQVVGAVLRQPMTVAGIARVMGLARQSVQRTADVLVADGFARYVDNPAHRRAKLLEATPAARDAIAALAGEQRRWAAGVAAEVGAEELARTVTVLHRIGVALGAQFGTEAGPGPVSARNPVTGQVWADLPPTTPES